MAFWSQKLNVFERHHSPVKKKKSSSYCGSLERVTLLSKTKAFYVLTLYWVDQQVFNHLYSNTGSELFNPTMIS